jgi:hypothetical protein
MTAGRPNVVLAFVLASPALVFAAIAGAFLGLHADGLAGATFAGPVVYRLVVAGMVRSMSAQPTQDRPAKPFWRLDVLDVLLIYSAAAVLGVSTSGRIFGTAFPSSWSRAVFSIVLTLLLSIVLEIVTTLSSRSRSAVRIGTGIITSFAAMRLFLGHE